MFHLDLKGFPTPLAFLLESHLLLLHTDFKGSTLLSQLDLHFLITSDSHLFLGCLQLSELFFPLFLKLLCGSFQFYFFRYLLLFDFLLHFAHTLFETLVGQRDGHLLFVGLLHGSLVVTLFVEVNCGVHKKEVVMETHQDSVAMH